MKTSYTAFALVVGTLLVVLLSYGVYLVTQDITKTIAVGISNMYSVGE